VQKLTHVPLAIAILLVIHCDCTVLFYSAIQLCYYMHVNKSSSSSSSSSNKSAALLQVEMIGCDVSDYVHADDRQLLIDYCNALQPSAIAGSFSLSDFTSSWSSHCTGQWSMVSAYWSVVM